ncbi:N-acetylneuraminate epimerase [Psittacicella hinzii]|uniref:N-acetylneuraminic acid mutarotase n=1 Tax=Psittacicella hinzii TaxID=2028575 RepID=A0A3A1YS22_9GAMM|nr:N-acetylneuraminate epimerase [Psittacicella hinzii]RIY40008.1 N-acetylneuraminic acid mutarotase [Psittacicella hinzii]
MKKLALKSLATFSLLALAGTALANQYPNLPSPVAQGGGALIGDTAYVGLGSAGKKFFALDLKAATPTWRELAEFPGEARVQPVVVAVNGKIYVFGGLAKVNGVNTSVNDAYVYDPATNKWSTLNTRSPLGLVGAAGVNYKDKIYVVGGTNFEIFNGFFKDHTAAKDDAAKTAIANAYFDLRAEDYFFNNVLFSYNPATNKWANEGSMEMRGRAGAGVAVYDNKLYVVSGEIKPGLRTDKASVGKFERNGEVDWESIKDLPANPGEKVQDGVAGSYTAFVGKTLFVAGGANFPGAHDAYKAGKLYAHQGLKKVYQKASFVLNDGKWSFAGDLPLGSGYGVTLSYGNQALIFGGETDGGKGLAEVWVVTYDPATNKVSFK